MFLLLSLNSRIKKSTPLGSREIYFAVQFAGDKKLTTISLRYVKNYTYFQQQCSADD